MKNMIITAERGKKNKKQLVMKNLLDKIAIAKVPKMSCVINLSSKYSWVINNADIDVARDLELISIKKW